ncbi:MAG: acyl-CoA dehydrogenase family protein [Desulfococcus multivorans]|nr:acyl-CoA dehydrogenase family protein [Desulfococcus multivorans]
MEPMDVEIIDRLLRSGRAVEATAHGDFMTYRRVLAAVCRSWETPVDRAAAGGFAADCVAFAFAAGYTAALQRLVPGLPEDAVACLCVTEAGGGHPRAIMSRLSSAEESPGRERKFLLNGAKKFATCAAEADVFLVAASMGTGADGRNNIRIVRIDAKLPGIQITPMADVRLVPEISHGEVLFTDVMVDEADLLPGDGYRDYIKPFRIIEDIHVTAGILGYLFRSACVYRWRREIRENILGRIASIRSLALSDPAAPAVHILLADALRRTARLVERLDPYWARSDAAAGQAWDRDKLLMTIADKARARRLETAWEFYEKGGSAPTSRT